MVGCFKGQRRWEGCWVRLNASGFPDQGRKSSVNPPSFWCNQSPLKASLFIPWTQYRILPHIKFSVRCKANQAKKNRPNWPIDFSAYYFFTSGNKGATLVWILKGMLLC